MVLDFLCEYEFGCFDGDFVVEFLDEFFLVVVVNMVIVSGGVGLGDVFNDELMGL